MAKIPPAAADAPVLDDPVDTLVDGDAAPRRFSLRLPKLSLRLPAALQDVLRKLPGPKLMLSTKALIILAGGVVFAGVAGAAAYAFWPSEPEWPRTPVAKKPKAKKPTSAAAAVARAASALAPLAAASAAASAASAVAAVGAPASGPENSMDRLQRRLAEVMGGGGQLRADGPGEWRLTRRAADAPAAPAARAVVHSAASGAGAVEEHIAARAVHAPAAAHVAWSYEGLGGPESWGKLKPEYAKCSNGTRQSPIDLRDGIQVQLDPVKFEYQASRFSVVDNGHTVQVNVAPGNFIEVMGRRFELQQFHFHRPSEERIDGRQFDMTVHLVHKDADGKLAVVAVLLEPGAAQSVVQAVWNNLPLEKGEEQAAQTPIDLQQLLPAERSYFTYMGSLTTPPCSEGVLWMVMKKPVPVSPEQLLIFARLYPMNARPVQSASGRMIKESSVP